MLILAPQAAHHLSMRRTRILSLESRVIILDIEREGGRSSFLHWRAIRFESRHLVQLTIAPSAALCQGVDRLRVAAIDFITVNTSPLKLVVDFVRVTGFDVKAGILAHGDTCPPLENFAMRRVGGLVDNPSCGVAHLVTKCVSKARFKVHHLIEIIRFFQRSTRE